MKDMQEINLNREDETLIKHFMTMCQEKILRKAKLTRGKFKAYLTTRYKGAIADKITNFFSNFFINPMDFDYFCDVMEKFMNFHKPKILRLIHSIYDFNEDRFIDELDVYCFISIFELDN